MFWWIAFAVVALVVIVVAYRRKGPAKPLQDPERHPVDDFDVQRYHDDGRGTSF